MNLLAINQFFPPATAATGDLLADIVNEHDGACTVICGYASYQPGNVAAEREIKPRVSVRRVGSSQFSHRTVGKLRSYAAFFGGALREAMRTPEPGVVLTMTTPPLLSLIGYALQRFRGVRHFIWEMDVYPDIANDLEILSRRGAASRLIAALADFTRRRADGVIVLGPCMAERLRRHGIPAERIHVCHNWADGTTLKPRPFVRDGHLKLLYSGNFGLAHDFETLLGAIQALSIQDCVHFSFNGGGPRKESVRQACHGRASHFCDFNDLRPLTHFGETLAACDAGLVLQKAATCGSVVPSKTYGIMAAGRPVIFIGPSSATPAQIIREHRIGWHIHNGDSSGLVRLLQHLAAHPDEIEAAGARARDAFERHYSKTAGVARVLSVLGASPERQSQPTQEHLQTELRHTLRNSSGSVRRAEGT